METKKILDEQNRKFFGHLWRRGKYAYYWTRRRSYWFSLDQPIPDPPNLPICTYFGVHPTVAIPQTNAKGIPTAPEFVRSQIRLIQVVNTLFAEVDFQDFDSKYAAQVHIMRLPLKPSVVIFSGGGYHLYWFIEPFEICTEGMRSYVQEVQYNWVQLVDGDAGSRDLARLLRVPFRRNYKPKYAPDFPLVQFVIANFDRVYKLSFLDQISRPKTHPELTKKDTLPPAPTVYGPVEKIGQRKLNLAACMIQNAGDGEKHRTLLRASKLLGGYVAGGFLTYEQAQELLETEIGKKPNVADLKAAYKTIKDGLAYGMAEPITYTQTQ